MLVIADDDGTRKAGCGHLRAGWSIDGDYITGSDFHSKRKIYNYYTKYKCKN